MSHITHILFVPFLHYKDDLCTIMPSTYFDIFQAHVTGYTLNFCHIAEI